MRQHRVVRRAAIVLALPVIALWPVVFDVRMPDVIGALAGITAGCLWACLAITCWTPTGHVEGDAMVADHQPRGDFLVVQDLRPFGYRVEGSYRTRCRAEAACRYSRYLKVETREFVEGENTRLRDHDEFKAALMATRDLDRCDVPFRRYSQSLG